MQIQKIFPELNELAPDIAELLRVALEAAASATSIHQIGFDQKQVVSYKELRDIVTKIDVDSDAAIKRVVNGTFPDHKITSEELPRSVDSKSHWWIVDPLDGTVNYTAGIPFYSTSIAVQRNGETIIGVVQAGALSEVYVGVKGHGSYCNGKRLKVSTCADLKDAMVSFMLTSNYTEEQLEDVIPRVRSLSRLVRGMRLYVGQALELSYIASGRLEGHFCIKSRGFSGAAGTLILREAGGQVTDLQGVPFSNGSRSMVASNGYLHSAISDAIKGQ